MNIKVPSIFLFTLLSFFFFSFTDSAKAAPPNFKTEAIIEQGLAQPTAIGIAPDNRLFILELGGKIKIYKNGQLLPAPFTSLPSSFDGGLLGVTFDPDFKQNHFVYFYYSGTDRFLHVVRFDATQDVAPGAPVEIFKSDKIIDGNHNGGTIEFGLDRKLYISIGDNHVSANAQNLTNDFGKIHRINKDGSIPLDNPFIRDRTKKGSIWAYGLRNPFRFQFKNGHKLYVGDVGEDTWEEINLIKRGKNYGWPAVEGKCDNCDYENPIHQYGNVPGSHFSLTQGPVYQGNVFPKEYRGNMFIGDFVQGWVKVVEIKQGVEPQTKDFETNLGGIVDIKEGLQGELYVVSLDRSKVYKITFTKPPRK